MDLLRVTLCLTLALASACSSSPLRLPEIGPHVDEAPVIVPYPPPPARVEIVPPAPGKTEVWVDGQWIWRGNRWVWQAGGWQITPKNSYYAPPVTLRQQDGSLAYFEGGFRERARRQ